MTRARNVGPKVGQIGPNGDKSGTFSDQISVIFGSVGPGLDPFWVNLSQFGRKYVTINPSQAVMTRGDKVWPKVGTGQISLNCDKSGLFQFRFQSFLTL